MLLALTGYARSGKDTVGKILVERHGFRRVAFGDVLKRVAEDMNPSFEVDAQDREQIGDLPPVGFTVTTRHALDVLGGWEKVKDEIPEARQWLVDLGNSLRRHVKGIEVSAALSGVNLTTEDVVNTNVYHPEEIDQIRALPNARVYRVLRPGFGPANGDEARTGCHPVDGEIYNRGSVEDLEQAVRLIVDEHRHQLMARG